MGVNETRHGTGDGVIPFFLLTKSSGTVTIETVLLNPADRGIPPYYNSRSGVTSKSFKGKQLNKEEKRIITLTTGSHFLVHLFEGVLPPLIPLLMLEFGTDYFHMGLVVTVFSYAFGIGSLPAGYLADKIGPRRLITLFLFGAGILAMGVWSMNSLVNYGILMGGIGLFCSTYHPASNTLISLGIREKGKAFGIHGIAGSLGVASVPVLSAWIGSALGWRMPHVLYGIFGILVGFYSLTIPRRPEVREKEMLPAGNEHPLDPFLFQPDRLFPLGHGPGVDL